MPFTTEDFHDLVRLVETHPEWRAELRRLVLSEEMLSLPEQIATLRARSEEQFHALLEAQQHTEVRLEALTARVDALTVQVDTLTARVDALTVQVGSLTARVDALTVQVDTLTARVDALTVQVDTLTARVDALTVQVDTLTVQVDALVVQMSTLTAQVTALAHAVQALTDDVGALKGMSLEMQYRFKGPAYFGRMLRRSHVLTSDELIELLEDARERGFLSDAQSQEIYDADLVVRGRRAEDRIEVYLVVEVSWGVGIHDVERATQRASLLSRLGVLALPVVAGKWVSAEAQRLAQYNQVWQLTDGLVVSPAVDET